MAEPAGHKSHRTGTRIPVPRRHPLVRTYRADREATLLDDDRSGLRESCVSPKCPTGVPLVSHWCPTGVPLVSQQATEDVRNTSHTDSDAHEKTPDFQGFAMACDNSQGSQMDDTGLEPVTSTMSTAWAFWIRCHILMLSKDLGICSRRSNSA